MKIHATGKLENVDHWSPTRVRWLMTKRMFDLFDDFTPLINYHRYILMMIIMVRRTGVAEFFSRALFSLYAPPIQTNWSTSRQRERRRETPNTLYHYLSFTYVSTYADMLISLLWKTRPKEFNTNELCVCVSAWMRTSSINMTTYMLKRFMPFPLITWSSSRDMIRVYRLWCVNRYCRVR